MAPTYTTTGSQISFILNTAKLNFTAAESWCALNGGHLAAFVDKDEQASLALLCAAPADTVATSQLPLALGPALTALLLEPQKEVEEYYISHGYILPSYHKQYWMGLNSSGSIFPNFTWLTPDVDSAVYLADYSHWGTSQPLGDETKMCAGGNFNMSNDGAWGWANDDCTLPYIFMCRIMRELPGCLAPLRDVLC